MAASSRSVVRRTGRVLTGFGALAVLCGVLVGAPLALLGLAGNPLPDHLPTIAEVGAVLTSRDDGRLFLRALALAGWFGWATFALSVLVELGAQALRRPAPRLPGMSRQQRVAAALVGSVALIVAASPAASAATAAATPAYAPAPGATAPLVTAADGGTTPVYRAAKGDYLGEVAERYLDEFGDYRRLATLNRLADPDRIRPGQLIRLPDEARDRGTRPHATGRLVARPAASTPGRTTPAVPEQAVPAAPEQGGPEQGGPEVPEQAAPSVPERMAPPAAEAPDGGAPPMTVGAARAGEPDRVNRPLAVSAVLAVASIVGAQIGAVLGLRRRPAAVQAGSRPAATGRHRRD
ncbi:LysM peptidoglycan-binding domain-containing protein [Micromonospora deserti]|uniref:Peptidoglycan-binding protein n=1 Tax=Micromonospora deserti TaxID=2070366 RepID=A0A2W2BX25_9ACTN|nr:LysM peptidoglycan-binding domain-containing protein [Micromonospora deserti]PZF90662.1 peptidoglycan-binding protein [Micromonospora deserti]